MARRTLLLIASILIAAVGTGMVAVYAQNAEKRAERGQAMVQVYVATKPIAAGVSGVVVLNSKLVEPASIPRAYVTESAVGDINEIRDLETAVDILPGQQIIMAQFAEPGSTESKSSGLAAGRMAVAVTVSDNARAASFLKPESEVAIYVSTGDTGKQTRLLYPKIRVIGVGATTTAPVTEPNGQQPAAGVPASLVTLELAPDQVDKVIYAATYEQLYFSVLGPGNTRPQDRTVTQDNLFSAS